MESKDRTGCKHTLNLFQGAKKEVKTWVKKYMVVKLKNWPDDHKLEGLKFNVVEVGDEIVHLVNSDIKLKIRKDLIEEKV